MTLAPGTAVGKYVVRRKLAEGGMAEIYLCASRGPEGFEKDVVIKRIRTSLASEPGFQEMFIAEARLASRLSHPNLVQIFDFDKHEDTYYLAMEYVRGRSLWDARRRAKELMLPMPITLVAHVGAMVARGLHHAHEAKDKGEPLGLVHRDVTPHNVLLSYEGAVKLTDFGIAKSAHRNTTAGTLKGKFAYMSPEQARGEEVDARTDVFALGVVLWEMLTGGRLFDGDSDVAVLRAVQHSAIAPPARLNPDVPPELDALVLRALQRERSERYQTAQELERALGDVIFKHARSFDDTDVGAYLRKLFPEEPVPVEAPPAAPPRQPTAVMRKPAGSGKPAAPSTPADEDVHAPTQVLASGAPSAEERPRARAPRSALTLGMRRGLLVGAGSFLLIGSTAAVISLNRKARSAVEAPSASAAPAVAAAPPPVLAIPEPVPQPAAPPPSTAEVAFGTLSLHVTPWAWVFVDDVKKGQVEGGTSLKLPAGEHRIRLLNSALKQQLDKTVSIEAGKTVELRHRFVAGTH